MPRRIGARAASDKREKPTRRRAGGNARTPAPFLKWAGGKGQLLDSILLRLPSEIGGTYYEPFIGGGAVFFELARQGKIKRARLFDANHDLVETYEAVRDDVDAVIEALRAHRNDEAYYYEVRAQDPTKLTRAQRAARTIFLNRVGFNGLYRVNASGQFNVPFGRYANPRIVDDENLKAASKALALAELRTADFETACIDAEAGDVVYLDPPYIPLSATSNFTSYARERFGEEEHRRLATVFAGIVERGGYALLSNSDTPLSRSLYKGFKVEGVDATRAINSNPEKRGVVREVLVSGIRVGRAARPSS